MPVITGEPAIEFTESSIDNLSCENHQKSVFAAIDVGLADDDLLTFFHVDSGSHADCLEFLFTLTIDPVADGNAQIEICQTKEIGGRCRRQFHPPDEEPEDPPAANVCWLIGSTPRTSPLLLWLARIMTASKRRNDLQGRIEAT